MQKDLDKLSVFRHRFDTELRRGNLKTAYDIYNLHHDRASERLNFILELLKARPSPLPLNSPDFLEIDDTQRLWQSNLNDLQQLWKKELIHH